MSKKKLTHEWLVGIDEAGRGPLAGPVMIGVVAIRKDALQRAEIKKLLSQMKDSKQLSEKKREALYEELKRLSKKFAQVKILTSYARARSIDRVGIAVAIKQSIARGLRRLDLKNVDIKLDGALKAPDSFTKQETIIKGDETIPIISAASVLAKVVRDRKMLRMHNIYPEYRFDLHKGYGTKKHRNAIKRHGASDIHRKSWLR